MVTLLEVAQSMMNDRPDIDECHSAAVDNGVCPNQLKTVFGHDLMTRPGDTPTQQLKTWILRASSLLDQGDDSHIPIVAAITRSSESYVRSVIAGMA